MALTSSSPGPEFRPHRSGLFQRAHLHHLTGPSSPTGAYRDGEISPTFDASFASSMSITSDLAVPSCRPELEGSPVNHVHNEPAWECGPSPPVMMDISPAPAQVRTTSTHSQAPLTQFDSAAGRPPARSSAIDSFGPSFKRQTARSNSSSSKDYPLLRNLFQPSSSAPVTRSSSPVPVAQDGVANSRRATDSGRPVLLHHSSLPSGKKSRLTFEQRLLQAKALQEPADSSDNGQSDEDETVLFDGRLPRPPSPTLSLETTAPLRFSKPPNRSRHTAPCGQLAPPSVPVKRLSEPSVPTFQARAESSPFGMDIDGASPAVNRRAAFDLVCSSSPIKEAQQTSDQNPFVVQVQESQEEEDAANVSLESSASGASDRLADFFADDLSPVPQSRKRFLADDPHSPTPASPSPALAAAASLLAKPPTRRTLEKSVTTTAVPTATLRRPRSSANLRKRPSTSALNALPPPPLPAPVETSHPAASKRHAPAFNGKPKSMRRAYSVADAVVPELLACRQQTEADVASHRASIATEAGYFGPSPSASRTTSMDIGSSCEKMTKMMTLHENGSPVTGFRSQEAKGKALPCFGVKEDGLMRISATTLNDVQNGVFSDQFARYLIIDCRFDYEFQGGHIQGAINLSELADVEQALLHGGTPPRPCTSENAAPAGKTVLIFHCEFSAKRAPTTLKNGAVYPNIHYPEVYVLQGGYFEYFKQFPGRCTGGYLAMDDPNRLAERSVNLNNFRNQKRQFQRANTFTFGQAQHASTVLKAATQAGRLQVPGVAISGDDSLSNPLRKPFQPKNVQQESGTDGFDKSFSFPSVKPVKSATTMTACHEEENEGDCSFGTNGSSPGGGGDSPCPVNKVGRHSLKIPLMSGPRFGGRRGLERAQTSSILMFTR